MPLISFLLNLAWLICGGALMAVGWLVASIVMALTIVGLPWARSAFSIARYSLLPFGHRVVERARWTGHEDLGTGALGALGNIIWLVLAGWWLALGHLGAALLLAVTIVGLPFAWAHLKLAGLALWPVGRMVVPADAVPAYARWR
ncbi:MAG TPA: YccF domain-containing protein [Stellaceae bacterium]|nr:YccF domain-containing protein [Stellaceae bacterium]